MGNSFSHADRGNIIQRLTTDTFDLIVIGGGITGAGIALDAATRGLHTCLLEKDDFAFGTSSRSTKLIHGGLRYLKQLEFGLVREVGSERAVVHALAPHLVVPEKMLLPLAEKRGLGYALTSIGLKIYDFLAGVEGSDRRRMLTRNQTLRYEPLLRSDDIRGGAIYAEYRTDDARLTLEVLKQAVRSGVHAINYVRVVDFVVHEERITGVIARASDADQPLQIRAKCVVNAAGPWVDELREINHSLRGKRLHLTKGVHIVVPHKLLPVKQAIYFDVADGRMIFAIPRGRVTYIGTTDTNYNGDKDNVWATRDDAGYLISAVNAMFPTVQLSVDDVESSWAGLRPLIHEEGKSASELSRKDEIFESGTGLISIAGGKLTGYRRMAERVVDLVGRKLGVPRTASKTASLRLGRQPFPNAKEVTRFKESLQRAAIPLHLQPYLLNHLVESYGSEAMPIVQQAVDDLPGTGDSDRVLLLAELDYCLRHEMVCTLTDFFVRRTGMVYFDITRARAMRMIGLARCAEVLHWTDARTRDELEKLDALMKQISRCGQA